VKQRLSELVEFATCEAEDELPVTAADVRALQDVTTAIALVKRLQRWALSQRPPPATGWAEGAGAPRDQGGAGQGEGAGADRDQRRARGKGKKRSPGRPHVSTPKADEKMYKDWKASGLRQKEFARGRGMKTEEVEAACKRHRTRESRKRKRQARRT
jgi:hypothetical protein